MYDPAMRSARLHILTAGLAATTLASCAASLNSRDTLGGSLELPALSPDNGGAVRVADLQTAPLTTISRADFEPRRFVVPVDGVRHQPTYLLTGLPEAGDSASWRDAGTYPTVQGALDVRGDADFEMRNAFAGPLAAALEIALSPIGLVITPPWSVTQSASPTRAAARAAGDKAAPDDTQETER